VSLERTRAAISQRFVAALPSVLAPAETIPVLKKQPAGTNEKQSVRQLENVVTTARMTAASNFKNPAPRYPDLLRSAEIEGAVVARFDYDARGVVDPSSIRILTSTHDLLTNSVRTAVAGWRGAPGTSAQVPFVFVLDNKSGKDLSAYPGGLPAGSMVVTASPAAGGALAVAGMADGPRRMDENATYFEFQVEQPVTPMPGNRPPRYPDALREAGVEGEVLAQFVVGPDGVADMSTFKVLKSTHGDFTTAVEGALPNMKFNAPLVGGRPVKQLVQMPFQFNLSKTP
jgi:TonB family protein